VKTKVLRALAGVTFAAACATPVLAQDVDHKPTYHEHFATCAHESKGLRGEEHQRFMSECLKDHGWAPAEKGSAHKTSAESSQQNRMKTCNDEAGKKNLHGDERRSFMSTCLKG
jgi:arylsulfatase A-like enzyme